MESQNFTDIEKIDLLNHVQRMKHESYRLVQICALKSEQFILLYSFEKEQKLENLRVHLDIAEEIESIDSLYSYAFLYENEIKDLFGIQIKDMGLDFRGNLYRTTPETPFNPMEEEVKEDE